MALMMTDVLLTMTRIACLKKTTTEITNKAIAYYESREYAEL